MLCRFAVLCYLLLEFEECSTNKKRPGVRDVFCYDIGIIGDFLFCIGVYTEQLEDVTCSL